MESFRMKDEAKEKISDYYEILDLHPPKLNLLIPEWKRDDKEVEDGKEEEIKFP